MKNKENTTSLLLDSKLKLATFSRQLYNMKIVEIGDYIQVYCYNKKKSKINNKDNDLDLKKIKNSNSQETLSNNKLQEIEIRNIIRSKLKCQRLAKANMKDWKTFITLTFAENITDINISMIKFKYFVDKVRRIKKDFKYLCITEFQKRGAVHFHVLTNIDINDQCLMYKQENNKKYTHIKYWKEGFTSVEILNSDEKKIIGYISKYMTKDIDNRLFSKHRYFGSHNLTKPIESFINTDNIKEQNYYIKKIQDKKLIYQNEYLNTYDNSKVTFLEFTK